MLLNSAFSVGQTSRSNCEGETSNLEQQACLSAKRGCLPTGLQLTFQPFLSLHKFKTLITPTLSRNVR